MSVINKIQARNGSGLPTGTVYDIGGGGNTTVIHVTMENNEVSVDKTFSELKYILENNVPFLFKLNGSTVLFPSTFSLSSDETEINVTLCHIGTWEIGSADNKGCSFGAISVFCTEEDFRTFITPNITGTLGYLQTTAKSDLVGAINELVTRVAALEGGNV